MGAFVGLLLGLGLLLLVIGPRRRGRAARRSRWVDRRRELLLQAGIETVTAVQLLAMQVVTAFVALLVVLVVSHSVVVALAFALFGFLGPITWVKRMRNRRVVELRDLWPEVVDNLGSAVRAGLSLPEALGQLGVRGPEQLRPPFARFGDDYRATGRFAECLDRLKDSLADSVGDRVCESLRMAREVGGTDLGRLLRTLSAFLREDARTRAELETRQGWTISAARLAVGAPWLVLVLLATQSTTLTAYDSPAGVLLLGIGGAVCFAAYRLMMRIGRLPEERRVLR